MDTVAACAFVYFWFLFWFRLVVFGMEKRKKKKIGEVEEEVDILHKMDNRCVFWSLCVLLKKKNHRKLLPLDLKKMFSAMRNF